MMEELLAGAYLRGQQIRLTSPQVTYRREWEATRKLGRLESRVLIERARLGNFAPTPTMEDVWRHMPV